MNTRVDLIKYIREKSPKLTGVYKMKKNELEEIYNKLTEIKEEVKEEVKEEIKEEKKEEVKEEIKEVKFDFSKLSKDDLKYDINMSLPENTRLSNINKATKSDLLKVIEKRGITKHYTDEEKEVERKKISKKFMDEREMDILKRLINKYMEATNHLLVDYHTSILSIEKCNEIIEKYNINSYDFTEYDNKIKEESRLSSIKLQERFTNDLIQMGAVIISEDDKEVL